MALENLIDKTINPNALISINNTSYYIQNEWAEVVRKYFKIASDDAESINFLKSSLFGYDTEITSNEIKNNVYHRNIIYDEHFINTASFPESIYNFAKTFNYDVPFSNPSHCRIQFAIYKDDLVNNKFREEVKLQQGSVTTTRVTYKLILNNDYTFSLNDLPFRLPYPVIITFKETADKKDFTLQAYYDTSGSKFPYLTLTNDYIKLWQSYTDGNKVVFLGLDLYQLRMSPTTINITSEDITANLFYEVSFIDQLAYFEVWYVYNGKSILLNTYFNNTYQPDDDELYCYYSILNNDTIVLSFSATGSSFRPALNSELLVKVYTTNGTEGNFNYIGQQVSVNFANKGEFDKTNIMITPITECDGGMDDPTYTEVKNGIINRFAVRDNLIIDNDLRVFFNAVNNQENVHGSNMEWIKKRNDVIKRVLNAYLTIRDKERRIIPTNTAPTLVVSTDYIKDHNYCISENTAILYSKEKKEYYIEEDINDTIKYTKEEIPAMQPSTGINLVFQIKKQEAHKVYIDGSKYYSAQALNSIIELCANIVESTLYAQTSVTGDKLYPFTVMEDGMIVIYIKNSDYTFLPDVTTYKATFFKITKDYSSYFRYRLPFLFNIQTQPILVGNYYSTYVNEDINMNFGYINPHIDDNFSIKEVHIFKNNIDSTKYTISLDMNSSYNNIERDYIIIRCLISDKNAKPYGFIDLLPQVTEGSSTINKFYFEGYLDINQDLIIDNNEIVISQLYNMKGGAKPQDIINNILMENEVTIQIAILLRSTETNYKEGYFNYMTDIDEYSTAIVYECEDTIEIFQNLYHFMESDVKTPNEMKKKLKEEYAERYGDKNYFFISQVPLVENDYFENVHESFFSVFNTYMDIVKDNVDYLENNTSVDVKLVNTYGPSNWYYYNYTYNEDTGEIQYDFLDNIHMNVTMNIYLNYYINDETDKAIKQYVSDFIESCNDVRLFPISNLITKLESNFEIIKYIEFFYINNIDTQKVKSRFTTLLDLSKEEVDQYVPEYLNTAKKLDMSAKRYKEIITDNNGSIKVEDRDFNSTLVYPYNHNVNITYLYN